MSLGDLAKLLTDTELHPVVFQIIFLLLILGFYHLLM